MNEVLYICLCSLIPNIFLLDKEILPILQKDGFWISA